MKKVNAVLGEVSADRLGTTLMHEHFFISPPGTAKTDAAAMERDYSELLKEVGDLRQLGVTTIADANLIDNGRNVELAKKVSERTGVNVILSTGIYYVNEEETERVSTPFKSRSQTIDVSQELYERFVEEITVGIGNTGVKAGLIKIKTGKGQPTRYGGMVVKAAIRAHLETGVPIITHTELGMGLEQASHLISEGINPAKAVVGHMCDNTDILFDVSVLEKGVYLGFDRFGFERVTTDALKIACLVGLLSMGFANRILLSQDYAPAWQRSLPFRTGKFAPWVHNRIFKHTLPALKAAGIGEDKIHTMMVENPRRLFEGQQQEEVPAG